MTQYREVLDRVAARPGLVLFPLRVFLGVTFCYAGLQKLANPNFFRAASPISIQAQLVASERVSPLHSLLGHLIKVATPLGLLIAISELAIGLGVLTGVLTRLAALGGMVLSFMLFLTVSFHSRPWYTGADIGYVFAFTPFLIAGAGDFLTLPDLWKQMSERYGTNMARVEFDGERRRLLVAGSLGVFGVVLAALDAGLGRAIGGARSPAASAKLSTPTTSPTTTPGSTTNTSVGSHPSGAQLGPASDVPVGGAASFQDPASGDPALVLQRQAGQFVAFDAVCPHAGCTVQYQQSQDILVCPCHGSLFNASTGAVETGPAATGLRPITISESNGQLYAQ
jgi:thiosulfate dehydrogenase [quinone] large subunit